MCSPFLRFCSRIPWLSPPLYILPPSQMGTYILIFHAQQARSKADFSRFHEGLAHPVPHAERGMGNRKMGTGLVLGFLQSAGKMSSEREDAPRSEKQQGIRKVKQENLLQF